MYRLREEQEQVPRLRCSSPTKTKQCRIKGMHLLSQGKLCILLLCYGVEGGGLEAIHELGKRLS